MSWKNAAKRSADNRRALDIQRSIEDRMRMEGASHLQRLRECAASGDEAASRVIELLEERLGNDEDLWKVWLNSTTFEGDYIGNMLTDGDFYRVARILRETPVP